MGEKELLAAYREGFYVATERAVVLIAVMTVLTLVLIVVNPLHVQYISSGGQPYCQPISVLVPGYDGLFVCDGTPRSGSLTAAFPYAVLVYGVIALGITTLLGMYLFNGTLQIRRVMAVRANATVLGLLDAEEKEGEK